MHTNSSRFVGISLATIAFSASAIAQTMVFNPGTGAGESLNPGNHFDYTFGSIGSATSGTITGSSLTVAIAAGQRAPFAVAGYAIGGDFNNTASVINEATAVSFVNQSFIFNDFALSVPAGTELFALNLVLVFGTVNDAGNTSGGSITMAVDQVTGTTGIVSSTQASNITGVLNQVQFFLQGRATSDQNLTWESGGLSLTFDSITAIPEPASTVALAGAGLLGFTALSRRRRA